MRNLTPFPWIYNRGAGTIRANTGITVEVVARYVDSWNGPVMAAAPELLAALKEALLYIGPTMRPAPDELYAKIESAIAKAEGQADGA